MGLTDASGLPIAVDTTSASPHEVTLVDSTLDSCFLENVPEKLISDRAYDSDRLDKRLAIEHGVELIAPHKNNRIKVATQDGRVLRRFKKYGKLSVCLHGFKTFAVLLFVMNIILKTFLPWFNLAVL